MPELPEVEVTRLTLAQHALGRKVCAVTVRDRRLRQPVPEDLARQLVGQTLRALQRRGKYLLWRFDHGTLLTHQGMSGVWWVLPSETPARPHDHLDIAMEGALLRFRDPRRFGLVLWHPAASSSGREHPLLEGLGVEPLDEVFDGAWLYAQTRGRQVAIKPLLLAGRVVVGVGNIYASEALFAAGIRPQRRADRLSRAHCERLAQAVREVLRRAIDAGGSTLRDFSDAHGQRGGFTQEAAVYGREGQPCRRCAQPIRRIVQQQRASYFCARCQS